MQHNYSLFCITALVYGMILNIFYVLLVYSLGKNMLELI